MVLAKKKADSLIVSYVMLIIIGMSISVLVYSWLRSRAIYEKIETCPEGVFLIIKSYDCSVPYKFNVTIQNKGTFSVDGFVMRSSKDPNSNIGTLNLGGKDGKHIIKLKPSEDTGVMEIIHTNVPLEFVEIQPFLIKTKGTETKYTFCEQVLKQKLNC